MTENRSSDGRGGLELPLLADGRFGRGPERDAVGLDDSARTRRKVLISTQIVTKDVEFRRRRQDRLGRRANRRLVHGVIINVRHDAPLGRRRFYVGKGRLGARRRPVEQKDVRRALFRHTFGRDEARAARATSDSKEFSL